MSTGQAASMSLNQAGQALQEATEAAFPLDDPLRPVLEAIPPILAALEAEKARFGQDYAEKVGKRAADAALAATREALLPLMQAQIRQLCWTIAGVIAGVAVLAFMAGWIFGH